MSNRPRAERPSEAVMRMTDGGKSNKVKVLDSSELIEAARVAIKTRRNRQIDIDRLMPVLDDEGVHIVAWSMIHNDAEVRVRLLVKLRDSMVPAALWLDVPFKTFFSWREVEADISQEEAGV